MAVRSHRTKHRRSIGSGAFGQVLLAYDTELKRRVAIKTLHPQQHSNESAPGQFREEARRAASLDHPHIVAVYDVGTTEGDQCYVVSKYIEEGSLKKRMQARPLSREEAVEIVACLAEALHHAHQKGLVHRDVKPDNVLLNGEGRPLLTDFGLALHESEQRHHRNEVSGSPPYMAPEQTLGKSQYLDGRTDVWALGVILYEMLTGRHPFGGNNARELFEEIRQRECKPPRQIDDTIPEPLQEIILKCLAKPVTDRYATAGDIAADLRQWQSQPSQPKKLPNFAARPMLLGATALLLPLIFLGTLVVAFVWGTSFKQSGEGRLENAHAPGDGRRPVHRQESMTSRYDAKRKKV